MTMFFVLWLIVVGDVVMICVGCVYGESPVRFVLSLYYMCAIQCVLLHLIEVCCFFICL